MGLLRSVGRPGQGAEIRVVDEQGRAVPHGTVGELVVRGPMVTQGHWMRPDATAEAFGDGWFHTGDGGRMNEDGYLFIVDRLKDMIISGGENVYSAEVEAALRAHDTLADATVIGIPDLRWGEAVQAVVVRQPGTSTLDDAALTAELQASCKTRLAGYKCPRSMTYTDALPLAAAGTVL